MKPVLLIAVAAIAANFGTHFAAARSGEAQEEVEVTVVGISDGDTLTGLTSDRRQLRVRLAEIDAPESSQAYGQQSKRSLSQLCFGKVARLEIQSEDRYGRKVAGVFCGGESAQKHQLKAGLAWVYDRYVHDKSLYVLQYDARRQRIGLWADPSAQPPWEYRHK